MEEEFKSSESCSVEDSCKDEEEKHPAGIKKLTGLSKNSLNHP